MSLAAVVLATALTACGGVASTAAPTGPASPSGAGATSKPAASGEEAAVETVFRSFTAALLARDFAKACALNAPETAAKRVENVNAGGAGVTTCEEAFSAIYAVPRAAEAADGIGRTTEVTSVTVTGDTAKIIWTAEVQGRRPALSNGARKIDGQWRLLEMSG